MPLIDLNDPKKNQGYTNANKQSGVQVGNDPVNNQQNYEQSPVQNLPLEMQESVQQFQPTHERVTSLGENMSLQAEMTMKTNDQGIVEYASSNESMENVSQNPNTHSEILSNNIQQRDISNELENRVKQSQSNFDITEDSSTLNSFTSLKTDNDQKETLELNLKQYDLSDILLEAIEKDASDIHLSVGHRAIVRVNGKLETIASQTLTSEMINEYVRELIKSRNDIQVSNISQVDVGYTFRSRRFRVNIYKQMGNFSIVARIIPGNIKTIEEMNLPLILKEFADIESGFVLVTGPTGSGKSTTLASTLNNINATKGKHIITLEDPIEFVFPRMQSLIDQREFGIDFKSWGHALKAILRQDPDIVLVGEMRDLETISSAITVAETGHLVFSTLHTNSASQTVDRIIDVFPVNQQPQIRAQLANVITAVISQRLVPTIQGGRRAAMEIMIATPAIKNAIREGKTHQIDNMIQTGHDYGMYSLEKSLVTLVKDGVITEETAKSFSSKPEEIEMLLSGTTGI
ncbi:MAG: hypothetical protein Kow0081_2240 [Candidatus Dojkabacteria bacterium]